MSLLRRRSANLVVGGRQQAVVPEVVRNFLVTVAVLGQAAQTVELTDGATVGDALTAQGVSNSPDIDIRNSSMKPVRWEDPIEDGETIAVVPRVTGGNAGIGSAGIGSPSSNKKKKKKRSGSSGSSSDGSGIGDVVETIIDSCSGDDD